MVTFRPDYISVGGNRHPSAADWDTETDLLAYGANNNVAIWSPDDQDQRGVRALLTGHTDKVNAVKFCSSPISKNRLLFTGSVDKTIRVWEHDPAAARPSFKHVTTLHGHDASVNCIAFDEEANICASGAADGTVRIWRLEKNKGIVAPSLLETITLKPRYFPLALTLRSVPAQGGGHSVVMAVGGTRTPIQLYVSQDVTSTPNFQLAASLVGHEAWIRSLEFNGSQADDFLLASASQDKYIRLWRVRAGEPVQDEKKNPDQELVETIEKTLSNKAYSFDMAQSKYSVTFEALLFGHEDWIYTLSWNPNQSTPQLLSASADNSLVIWEPDPVSGVWYSAHRMGEISVQKGSTTATGSAGGFWVGLWSPHGNEVVCLGRTGSWRRWAFDQSSDLWIEKVGISGHVRSVNGVEWEPNGAYLLSTSADQTTRLHAEWKRDGQLSWHEFSRPQIHGYDLNCLASVGPSMFVSGADEKLLRVFEETKVIAHLLRKLSAFTQDKADKLPEAANIPVLGLSNKALDEDSHADAEGEQASSNVPSASQVSSWLNLDHPPFEDHLSKFSLWPEYEKLYGHGYEISTVAATHDRRLIATACKASSIDHAVIRLYDTTTWVEIRPPLTAHSLTITSLAFSKDDRYLVSVGRDRQWTVFERDEHDPTMYTLLAQNPKGHSRMILDACWAPTNTPVFVTAGRDKTVNVWRLEKDQGTCVTTIRTKSPVSAIACFQTLKQSKIILAVGENSGQISIHLLDAGTLEVSGEPAVVPAADLPSKPVTQVAWRPAENEVNVLQLAVGSEDTAVRIYAVDGIFS